MLELYIFNKESPAKNGLTYWDESNNQASLSVLSFNLDRFKLKDNNSNLASELSQELNYLYKESDALKAHFEKLSGLSINLELRDNFHHLVLYNSDTETLILDSKIQNKLYGIYLFAAFYALSRKTKTEEEIFSIFHSFFEAYDWRVLDSINNFLDRDKSGPCNYDAGGFLQNYLTKLQLAKQGILNEEIDWRLETQLLRNRALAGKQPFDLELLENTLKRYSEDPFSGDASEELYQEFLNSYNKEEAKLYYKHLCDSIKAIGLKVVAQRGSRVAHEQGPLLINSGAMLCNEEFSLKLRKIRSSMVDNLTKLEESCIANEIHFEETKNEFLKLYVGLDNLAYLCDLKNVAKARFERSIIELDQDSKSLIDLINKSIKESPKLRKDLLSHFETIKSFEKNLLSLTIDLEDLVASIPINKKVAVVYVQRPSSRSGHFLTRIILGQKLYIETDEESQTHRLDAIAYNFVCPDFELIAAGCDSFFENASISIVTDRDTGKPDIKWSNAEDLAISLAPGMYQAIKSANDRGENFHYQLETTLLGPLIELFLTLLETEISNIASIAKFDEVTNYQELLNIAPEIKSFKEILNLNRSKVIKAAKFVFEYYLLENSLQEHALAEGMSEDDAIFDMVLGLSDVQKDIANYILLKDKQSPDFNELENYRKELDEKLKNEELNYTKRASLISTKLASSITKPETYQAIKKYLRYPESYARKEFLANNPHVIKIAVSANKKIADIDLRYDFSVAPSRIDFGKHVVASVTTLMGRMLGADDLDSLQKAKEYIDLVSKTQNSFFESASEAGSVKVIENTCRAIQYSKAISFQGVFQSFNVDGMLARLTVNSRDTKAAGIHIMEYGTMASTGYCITKEPLFILLGLAINSNMLLEKLGIADPEVKQQLTDTFKDMILRKKSFSSSLEWQSYCYNELAESDLVQKYLSDPKYKWLPKLESMVTLFQYISDNADPDAVQARAYSVLSSKLIEFARVINETGIIQRVQLMNEAINIANNKNNAKKGYEDLRICLNASYKGNVSDERENANQYIMALLLHQKQYLKNASNPSISKLIEYQIKNYALPKEIVIYDPLVDADIFMGGELKERAESCLQKIEVLDFAGKQLDLDVIKACAVSYGSDIENWRIVQKHLKTLEPLERELLKEQLAEFKADLKYLETYSKGFQKDYNFAFQGLDVIQLNADHQELKEATSDLPRLKSLMQISNPGSLLVLIDNPQQAKKPLFDFDKSLEWMALGGTIASHLVGTEIYQRWAQQIEKESTWAKLFMQKQIMLSQASKEELEANPEFQKICKQAEQDFDELRKHSDTRRDLVIQKFKEAQEMAVSHQSMTRYREIINCYSRLSKYESIDDLDFIDWLVLGGRWILNGLKAKDIDYIANIFNSSDRLRKLGKRGHETMQLFVKASSDPQVIREFRSVERAGSTKEADLLVGSAASGLEYRALQSAKNSTKLLRIKEFKEYDSRAKLSSVSIDELEKLWDTHVQEYIDALKSQADDKELSKHFARLLKVLEKYSENFQRFCPELKNTTQNFLRIKEADNLDLIPVFGDHRKHGGAYQSISLALMKNKDNEEELASFSKLGEMFTTAYLIFLTLGINDENEMINKLSIFFDQYLNVHEEDYPPYMFHSLCAGDCFGFNQTYYLDTNLRAKMFKLACKTGIYIYRILHHLISKKTILDQASQEYRDALIGDYENGIIPIGYQHEGICIEERLWDCMRSLRNFIRNYHDRHPLPVVIKGSDATVDKLFRFRIDSDVELCWIAGISNPGKHSWDLNCVLRSPSLRDFPNIDPKTGQKYINISAFTPYLSSKGEIKQIYTSLRPELLEENKINYLCVEEKPSLNQYGFVHALISLQEDQENDNSLPKPSITMSAHTHPQYTSNFIRDLGVPEVWSLLSMQQMYAKTVLPEILELAGMDSLAQLNFSLKEFNERSEVSKALDKRLEKARAEHIDYWILKGSRDSGGRGISGMLSLAKDRDEILDFILQKSKTDDVVMQEFVPNNARAFISTDFAKRVEDAFVEEGIAIERQNPLEKIFFAMRSFQSISGIKGYLFSANIGSVTVNAGQGAKMFYGEPIYIMPVYIASKIQKLLDEDGETILKSAIPKHAEKFARANDIAITNNNIDSNNCFMLNGLFDYIPYLCIEKNDKQNKPRKFKIFVDDNAQGGLDYYYSYYGERVDLISSNSHSEALSKLEELLKNNDKIDIELAKIEFNSGLGQANLLQKTIEDMVPEKKDIFLEWTEDLGSIGIMSLVKQD